MSTNNYSETYRVGQLAALSICKQAERARTLDDSQRWVVSLYVAAVAVLQCIEQKRREEIAKLTVHA